MRSTDTINRQDANSPRFKAGDRIGYRSFAPIAWCLCVLLLQTSAFGQAIKLPPVTRVTLGNGIRVVLMEYHRAPTLTVNAQFPGGSATDSPAKAGAADLAAELLRKGTDSRSAQQIAESIDFLGGSLGAGAGPERLSVTLGVQSKDMDAGLDLFADVIRRPTFPTEELERERKLSIDGLEAISEDPGAVARRVAAETVYGAHPYGLEPTITSLKAITRDDLTDYYHRYVVPDRMIVVAVGDFKTADMLARLKARFGDWPKANTPQPATPPVPQATRKLVLIDKPDATQTQVRWTRVGFARKSPDYFAAQIADAILGGGFTSRLIDEVRVNRSLTYSIGSSFSELLSGGTFGVSTFTKIETTRALIDAATTVLKRAATEGLTAAELAKVKGYLAGMYAVSMQTPEALAGQLGEIAFYGLPADYLQTYLPRLRAVTLADANRIARTYFPPEKLSLVLVAPAAKVMSQLKGLGSFDVRPVSTVGK
jgi:zinc protease